MAAGVAEATRNQILDAFARNVSFAVAALWIKLHTGDPGAAGTTNPAGNTTRQQATFGSAASVGAIANTAIVQWLAVSTAETYSRISFWTALTAGPWVANAQLTTARLVAIGDTFTIPIGSLTITTTGA
jgi:hypothetical protein